jgi:hypothetical protein
MPGNQLTFNTTSLSLQRAIERRQLIERNPIRPRALGPNVRHLLVVPDIDALLGGRTKVGVFPDASAEILIGKFCAGFLICASRKKTKRKPDVEQLEGFDEVWALCPRVPRPGWRILGRFFDRGVFIALRAWEKGRLFSHYDQAAKEVISDWESLFASQRPYSATSVQEYLGGVTRDCDQPFT